MGKEFGMSELLKLLRDEISNGKSLRNEINNLRTALNRLRLENEKLTAALGTDEMTGLLKKGVLYKMDFLELGSTIAMIDLDNFKKVNDTYGHLMGDNIIKLMASIIEKMIFPGDSPIHWGGDEFLIIFRNCPLEKAREKCQQIIEMLEEESKELFEEKNIDCFVSASAGLYYIDVIQSVNDALGKADQNLYEEKDNKRPKNRKKKKKVFLFKPREKTK